MPGPPKFKSEDVFSTSFPEVTTSFYLINETEDDLIKNFKFLNSIFAGTQWFHMNYGQIRSPNVYNVTCPGKFNLIWAAMDLQVKGTGKLYPNMSPTVLSALAKTNGIDSSVINSMKWPAAWNVKVAIKSLVPYNFNTYMYYLLNGENISKTKILATGQMMYEYGPGDMLVSKVFSGLASFTKNMKSNSDQATNNHDPEAKKSQQQKRSITIIEMKIIKNE